MRTNVHSYANTGKVVGADMIIYPDCWRSTRSEDSEATPQAMAALLEYIAAEINTAGHQPARAMIMAAAAWLRRDDTD